MTVVIDKTISAPRHPEKLHRPDSAILRKPDWIRVRAPGSREYLATREIVRAHNLHTVCEEAACPNIGECWSHRHATMMIMGDTCTRACAFCNVKTGLHIAEGAGARTRVAHDHHRGVTMTPTLTDVGTSRLLADRVQIVRADNFPRRQIFARAGGPYADPVGFAQNRAIRTMKLFRMARRRNGLIDHDSHAALI